MTSEGHKKPHLPLNKAKDFITVGEEMKYIEDYLTIQKIRYRDKFTVKIDVDAGIVGKKIPKLVIQPVVENAIVHGIEKKVGKGSLSIYGTMDDNLLKFRVIDDGVGMERDELHNMLKVIENPARNEFEQSAGSAQYVRGQTGMGIFNVNSRIKMLYGQQYGLNIDSRKNHGTEVIITLPSLTKK